MCGTDRSKRDYFCFGFVVHFLLCSLNLVFVWVFCLFWVFWLVGFCFALIEEDGEARIHIKFLKINRTSSRDTNRAVSQGWLNFMVFPAAKQRNIPHGSESYRKEELLTI